jgi:3-oxoadipate enol-lactonase
MKYGEIAMKQIVNRDCNLAYEVVNAGNTGDTVLFFNGSLSTMSSWLPITEILRKRGIQVLVHDMRGQLSSPWTGPISYKDHSYDAKAILEAEGLNRVHVVGISYGSVAAQTFAADWPDITKSLILVSAFSEMDANTQAWVKRFIEWGHDALMSPEHKKAAYMNIAPLLFSTNFAEKNPDMLLKGAEMYRGLPDMFFEGMVQIYSNQITNTPITHRLKEIVCPTLVVHAEEDILTPWPLSKKILAEIANSEVIRIPGAGHAVNAEKPQLVDSIMTGFISGFKYFSSAKI